jgi:aarF domain-containing kinase
VQNPEAERTFRGDVFALKVVIDAFMPQLSVAFDEIQKQFATEFDYRGECQNAIEIRANLQKAGFNEVIVPEVIEELCSEKIMVMEEVTPSTPLHVALEEQAAAMAKQKGISKEEFIDGEKARIEELSKRLAKEGKVIESVSAEDYARYIQLQKGKKSVYTALKYVYNCTAGWVLPTYDLAEDGMVVPLNAAKLVDDLMAVHGHEVLIDGCFNADPHPGNILYTNGKLALIDYGQVKRMDDAQRLALAKAFVLVDAAIKVDPRTDATIDPEVHARAVKSVASHCRAMGMETEKNLDETFYELNTVYLGRMDAAWVYPRNILQWTDHMEGRDPMGSIDAVDYLVMVNTASLMLRGLGEMLQQSRNLAVVWGPFARRALADKGLLADVEAEIATWTAATPPPQPASLFVE